MMLALRWLVLAGLAARGRASFCGPAAVPFSFEALPDGQPVLGCARPLCFGWDAEGRPAGAPSSFYRVNRKPDGYFRKGAAPAAPAAAALFQAQTASCAATFDSDQCASDTQWVGGIGPVTNVSGLPLALQCCEYEPLALSSDRGVATVRPGQIVIGGEVVGGERPYAFDFISDVAKRADGAGGVAYEVSVRRMPCLPPPAAPAAHVEAALAAEFRAGFARKAGARWADAAPRPKAQQAVLQEVDNIPVDALAPNAAPNPALVADNEAAAGGQLVGQGERVILEPTGQQTVQVVQSNAFEAGDQVVQGPFVADGEAEEVVDAVQGLELPEGQVPPGLVEEGGAGAAVGPAGPAGYGGGGGGGYGGGGGSRFCFAADSTVRLAEGGTRRMDQLREGDWVLTANRSGVAAARVDAWTHRVAHAPADFLHIQLEDGRRLKLTDKHFLYRSGCERRGRALRAEHVQLKPEFADKVRPGDCLFVNEDGALVQKRVERVGRVRQRGIYAPMTSTGDILVDDVLVSCYTLLNQRVLQQTFFDYARQLAGWPLLGGAPESADVELPLLTAVLLDLAEYVLPKALL